MRIRVRGQSVRIAIIIEFLRLFTLAYRIFSSMSLVQRKLPGTMNLARVLEASRSFALEAEEGCRAAETHTRYLSHTHHMHTLSWWCAALTRFEFEITLRDG